MAERVANVGTQKSGHRKRTRTNKIVNSIYKHRQLHSSDFYSLVKGSLSSSSRQQSSRRREKLVTQGHLLRLLFHYSATVLPHKKCVTSHHVIISQHTNANLRRVDVLASSHLHKSLSCFLALKLPILVHCESKELFLHHNSTTHMSVCLCCGARIIIILAITRLLPRPRQKQPL